MTPDGIVAVAIAVFGAVINGVVMVTVLKVKLSYIEKDVSRAHDRLNQINAPAARV